MTLRQSAPTMVVQNDLRIPRYALAGPRLLPCVGVKCVRNDDCLSVLRRVYIIQKTTMTPVVEGHLYWERSLKDARDREL